MKINKLFLASLPIIISLCSCDNNEQVNNEKYLQTLNETLNNSKNNDERISICKIMDEYLQNNNKKILNDLKGLVLEVLIELLKDK